jgi:hypothetical protein
MATQRPAALIIIVLAVFLGGAAWLASRSAPIVEQARAMFGSDDGAVQPQQRYRARRAAVAAMKADLRRLVAAEARITADSGSPRYIMPWHSPHYWTGPSRGNEWPFMNLTPNGWWATIKNTPMTPVTAIQCAVAVGGDTTFGSAKSGEPWCFGEGDWATRYYRRPSDSVLKP